jgi:integrase
MVMVELMEEFLNTWCDGLGYNTVQSYFRYCKHIKQKFDLYEFSDIDVADLKPYHIQTVLNELNKDYAPSTIVKYKAILHNMMKCAVRWDICNYNIVDSCVLPRHENVKRQRNFWTTDEAARFVYWLTKDFGQNYCHDAQEVLFILLALCSGARRGELVALNQEDVSFGQININKTVYRGRAGQLYKPPKSKYGERVVSVPPQLTVKLDDMMAVRRACYRAISPFVFTQRSDATRQMPLDAPSHFFNYVVSRAPVPKITLHGLRHTHASMLIAEGMDVATVSKRLGHSKTSVTLDIYTHTDDSVDGQSAALVSRLLHI